MKTKNFNILLEDINKLHSKFASIPMDIFVKIISLDPKTRKDANGEITGIGEVAQGLLLPKYMAGDNAWLDDESMTEKIQWFYDNRPSLPIELKNVRNFSNVQTLIDAASGNLEAASSGAQVAQADTRDPITQVYDKYYSDIPRDDFDKIIGMDPETTDTKIGSNAKFFLIPCYKKGERDFLSSGRVIRKLILDFERNKNKYDADKQDLKKSFASVADFMNFVEQQSESPFIRRMKTCTFVSKDTRRQVKDDIEIIGATNEYDILAPKSKAAAALIGCLCIPRQNGSYPLDGYGDPDKIRWCTTAYNASYYDTYNTNGNQLYCFMHKEHGVVRSSDREFHVQISVYLRHNTTSWRECLNGKDARDGVLSYTDNMIPEELKQYPNACYRDFAFYAFMQRYPELIPICLRHPVLGNLPVFKYLREMQTSIDLSDDGELKISSFGDIMNISTNIKPKIKKLVFDCEVETIPARAFAGCINLEEIDFAKADKAIKTISVDAFKGCTSLSHIKLPSSLKVLDKNAFADCANLRGSIFLPDTLEVLGEKAFDGCSNKLSLTINPMGKRTVKLKVTDSLSERHWLGKYLRVLKG